jgi:pre-rRNA-processing protein TSR1
VQERFQKYRGLKSFRTSAWDPKESLPQEYAKVFAFENFARARKLAAKATQSAIAVRPSSPFTSSFP